MRFLLTIFIFKTVTSSSLFVSDQCKYICKNANLPSLELENYEQVVCQRGCGFFNAIRFQGDINLNVTKKECHISCEESYIVKEESEICKTGCDLIANQEVFVTDFVIESEENIVLASPDREIEFDLLSDPSIKSQLETGVDYKIPETHIRTMPIEITEEEITVKESRDWLDCASYNSGIPRWILLSAILSAVLIALWLSFSTEKRNNQEPTVMLDINDDKMILISDAGEKDPKLLETNPGIYNSQEVNFSVPPKYSVECEKV
ncbi:transmembrane protein 59-like [Anoplophora glabripennis]|uniref:transmembrane protein 59-like n=1 Tax=Anoplophora glabripennis TaxID=217634 RepID=UPI00087374BD|nr:transmembrane protein 59-like [Anoplophora glabripennis]